MMAAPRFNGAVDRLGGDAAMNRIATRQPVDAAALDAANRSRRDAERRLPDAATLGDLALLRLVQARRLPADSNLRSAAVDESIAFTRAALARDPGSSYLWMRLAEGMLLKEGIGPLPVGPLHESLVTGPYLQGIAFPRLELAFLLERFLDDETRSLVRQQVVAMVDWRPDYLAESTRRRYMLQFVRDTLAADRRRLDMFDNAYARLR